MVTGFNGLFKLVTTKNTVATLFVDRCLGTALSLGSAFLVSQLSCHNIFGTFSNVITRTFLHWGWQMVKLRSISGRGQSAAVRVKTNKKLRNSYWRINKSVVKREHNGIVGRQEGAIMGSSDV